MTGSGAERHCAKRKGVLCKAVYVPGPLLSLDYKIEIPKETPEVNSDEVRDCLICGLQRSPFVLYLSRPPSDGVSVSVSMSMRTDASMSEGWRGRQFAKL